VDKSTAEQVLQVLPDTIKNYSDWLKSDFSKSVQDVLGNASGTTGIILKLLGKPLLDNHFKKKAESILANYGLSAYLAAAHTQSIKSIAYLESSFLAPVTCENIIKYFSESADIHIANNNMNNLILVFQPKYHPAIQIIKNTYLGIFQKLNIDNDTMQLFIKHFNENIETQIISEFGENYNTHIESIKNLIYKENEIELLFDIIKDSKIGFDESEDLKYETTFGLWKEISKYKNESIDSTYLDNNTADKTAKGLRPITDLINEYFANCSDNTIDKILFIIADFGKGKSVFLRHFASHLAKEYLQTGEGYLPIYFNLRNYKHFINNDRLGIINDYLLTKYGIDISSEYYKSKKYFFLIDSLDESGDLSKYSLDTVIKSVKQIQNIDRTLFRSNRIIITSRPINEELEFQLRNHCPHCTKDSDNRNIDYYISLFGFTKNQFNDWLVTTLRSSMRKTQNYANDFINNIFSKIDNNEDVDIYSELINNRTLTASELRRPIFAYMIYQLLINNVDFIRIGKLGIYLSFLNLLTKEAKHIKDPTFSFNLNEEYGFRNLLHATAALWMYERNQGNQGSLNKADICRVLDGNDNNETDSQVLQRYKDKGIVEIEFLSHSYFGENSNTLHFQHQSFAEILLAEYYLKVFIKFALDDNVNLNDARSKLILGSPTSQTINFLIDLLHMLKDSAIESKNSNVLEKRRLLFPFFASIATKKNNTLFCENIYYEWYKKHKINEYYFEYPEDALYEWCVDNDMINKILEFSKNVLHSNSIFIISKADESNALFNKELLLLHNKRFSNLNNDNDKWIALLVGNTLYNEVNTTTKPSLYNNDYDISPDVLFEMINNSTIRSGNDKVTHSWRHDLFMGINMRDFVLGQNRRLFSVLNYIDFSYSYLKEVSFVGCLLGATKFNNCTLESVDFSHSYLWGTEFENISLLGDCRGEYIVIETIIIPFDVFKLRSLSKPKKSITNKIYVNKEIFDNSSDKLSQNNFYGQNDFINIIKQLCSVTNNKKLLNIISRFFIFETEETKKKFLNYCFPKAT